jgi:quinol monooxygenase YgiN
MASSAGAWKSAIVEDFGAGVSSWRNFMIFQHSQVEEPHRWKEQAEFGWEGAITMVKYALYVPLKAKPGKETEVEQFLHHGAELAKKEPGTVTWYAIREGDHYAIFDTFNDEAGRDAHLSGEIAKALTAKAGDLLAEPPKIHKLAVLAAK